MGSKRDCRVYVGNLPADIRQHDLEDLFYKYGRINFIDVKLSRGAPFAFIEFDDPRYVVMWKECTMSVMKSSNTLFGSSASNADKTLIVRF